MDDARQVAGGGSREHESTTRGSSFVFRIWVPLCTSAAMPLPSLLAYSTYSTRRMTVSSNQTLQQQLLMLHPSVTSTLDSLVDRLNEASASNKDVFAVLLGTSDGISLAHSFGTDLESGPQLRSGLSEEVLSKIERTWATLPSDSLQGAGHYLRPLSLGGIITATVFFDNVVLTHVHFSPLVSTTICCYLLYIYSSVVCWVYIM
jgi:hypothetical protein